MRRFRKRMRRGDEAGMVAQQEKLQTRDASGRKCGWFCQQRLKWLDKQLPPPPPPAPLTPEQVSADAIVDASGIDPTVSGYFGSWNYF